MADVTLAATLAKQLSTLVGLMASGDGEAIASAQKALQESLSQQGLAPEQAKAVGETLLGNLLAGLGRGDSPEQAAQGVAQGAGRLVETVRQADAHAAQSLESALASGQGGDGLNLAAGKGGGNEAFQSALIQALQNGQGLNAAVKLAKQQQSVAQEHEQAERAASDKEPQSPQHQLATMLAGMSEEQSAFFLKAYQDALARGLDPRAALKMAEQFAEQHQRIQAEQHVEVPPAMRLAQALASGQNTQKALKEAGISHADEHSATSQGFTKALSSGSDPVKAAQAVEQIQSAVSHLESQQSVPISAANRLAMALANGVEAQNSLNALLSGGQGNQAFLSTLTQSLAQGAPITSAMQSAQSAGSSATNLAQNSSVPINSANQLMAALASGGQSASTAIAQASKGGGAEAFAQALNQALSQGGSADAAVQSARESQSASSELAAAGSVPVSAEQQLINAMSDPAAATSESFKEHVASGDAALEQLASAGVGGEAHETVAGVGSDASGVAGEMVASGGESPSAAAEVPAGGESVAETPAAGGESVAEAASGGGEAPNAEGTAEAVAEADGTEQAVASLDFPTENLPALELLPPELLLTLPPELPEEPVEAVDVTTEPPEPYNTAPYIFLPDGWQVDEDILWPIEGIQVGDDEADSLTVTLSVGHGTLILAQIDGLAFTEGDGSGDSQMRFTGSIFDINAALDGLGYQGESHYNGADLFELSVDDQGEYGLGGAMIATDSLDIVVGAVNDAPTNSLGAAIVTVDEEGMLVFAVASGQAIVVADTNDTGEIGAVDYLSTVVSVLHGTLSATVNGGATVTDNGTASVTIVGSAARVNAALEGLVYAPTAEYNGADTLTIETNDAGNNGIGGALTAIDTIDITVNAVNDAPTHTLAAASQTLDEDRVLNFEATNGNAIVVGDANDTGEAGAVDHLSTVVSVSHGTLRATLGGGASVTANGTASVTIAGTAAEVNAALDGLVYAPTADYNGADRLTIETSDEGDTGSGGPLTASSTIDITVNAVNDVPTHTLAAASQTLDEDRVLNFEVANGNAIVVGDANDTGEAGAVDHLSTVVSVSHGTLSATLGGGASVTANGTASVMIAGTAAQVNAALDGLVYAPTADYNGADTLTIETSDEGNSGSGGPLTASSTIDITVNALN
ncbi:MAG: hypothetical protein H7834_10095, partial [Magnetococcus sp. YQC-9]